MVPGVMTARLHQIQIALVDLASARRQKHITRRPEAPCHACAQATAECQVSKWLGLARVQGFQMSGDQLGCTGADLDVLQGAGRAQGLVHQQAGRGVPVAGRRRAEGELLEVEQAQRRCWRCNLYDDKRVTCPKNCQWLPARPASTALNSDFRQMWWSTSGDDTMTRLLVDGGE